MVAAGLSKHEPAFVYNGAYRQSYQSACTRVLEVLVQVIQPTWGSSTSYYRICQVAISAIERMNSYGSGSGVTRHLEGTELNSCQGSRIAELTRNLKADDCYFGMQLSQDFDAGSLNTQQRERLEPILVPLLSAAVHGVHKWWQYRNNEGQPLPDWLLMDVNRYSPIWLKDCISY